MCRNMRFALIILLLAACSGETSFTTLFSSIMETATTEEDEAMAIQITSTAFKEGEPIPSLYTCDSDNVSPPLAWSGVPEEAKSLVLISDDPDAPGRVWTHWVIYNLPPTVTELPEGVPAAEDIEGGGKHGKTDFGRFGYGGPCPPSGTHRYFFTLYALDTELQMVFGPIKNDVMKAMEGHILEEGQLMGTYQRQ
jgi:Raf kinase inhibitor-like YbhB/YbcL family protein